MSANLRDDPQMRPFVEALGKLYPSADKLAKLEEGYRKKYEPEVEEGEARFLNTEDIQFGSFLRRFESAVYGVWRYPEEAARMGIEGVTPVKITFNRKGEIEQVVISALYESFDQDPHNRELSENGAR